MNNKDIQQLVTILRHQRKDELANLLLGCTSRIDNSGKAGAYIGSTLGLFLIFAPLENYYNLKQLDQKNFEILYEAILDIHPKQVASVEITALEFRLLLE